MVIALGTFVIVGIGHFGAAIGESRAQDLTCPQIGHTDNVLSGILVQRRQGLPIRRVGAGHQSFE